MTHPHLLRLMTVVGLFLLALLAAPAASAQIGPGPFASFPSDDVTDGRFLGFGCPGLATFEASVLVSVEVPVTEAQFTLSVFDGDTGGVDGNGLKHWDLGSRELVFRVYADPLLEGDRDPAKLVATWTSNTPNPLSGPGWTITSASMPDNAWWGAEVATGAAAQAPSGNYFYTVEIQAMGACSPGELLESNLKIAASNPLSFLVPRFALVGGMRQLLNDSAILYPEGLTAGGSLLTAPTTYDGTFTFHLDLPANSKDLRIFDGDFDLGLSGYTTAVPSGYALIPCDDLDDPDTPGDDYLGFPFVVGVANPEGAVLNPAPPDDNRFDLFRRGELGDPARMGCIRYQVTAPDGTVYRNDNPSGGEEWEQFRIAGQAADLPGASDHLLAEDYLEGGIWTVEIIGQDLANLNFLFIENGTCPTRDGVPVCPTGAVYLIGDTVWLDLDGDGVQDPGEGGISGVVLELYDGSGPLPTATAVTGDTSSPSWANCVAHNTGLDAAGLYCFGVENAGIYEVRIAAENFLPGGALEGLSSTTGGEVQSNEVFDANVLTYDFGYRSPLDPPGTGTIGYWKNHPEAWPVDSIELGGVVYTMAEAMALLSQPTRGDITVSLAMQLLAAKLNLLVGNDGSCIAETIAAADAYLVAHPVGSKPKGADKSVGEALKTELDEYNNGLLCAPHRG